MGRIKSLMVKKAAKQLMKENEYFNENFDHNQEMLKKTMPSKSIQNKVAGYITRLVKMKRMEKEKPVKKVESIEPEQYQ